jgi:hypothetical protein
LAKALSELLNTPGFFDTMICRSEITSVHSFSFVPMHNPCFNLIPSGSIWFHLVPVLLLIYLVHLGDIMHDPLDNLRAACQKFGIDDPSLSFCIFIVIRFRNVRDLKSLTFIRSLTDSVPEVTEWPMPKCWDLPFWSVFAQWTVTSIKHSHLTCQVTSR